MANAKLQYRGVRRQGLDWHHCKYIPQGQVGDPCAYCGLPSNTMDHVPPIHYFTRLSDLGITPDQDPVLLPACHECNAVLGGALAFTVVARRQKVRDRLRRKYRAQLQMPEWDAEDLDEMAPEMARDILAHLKFRENVLARLAWNG